MSSKKLDIVFYVPSLDGGIGRVTTLLALGFLKKKNVEIWTASVKSKNDEEIIKKIKIRYIGKGSVVSSLIPLLSKIKIHKPSTVISASYHANCIALITSIFFWDNKLIIKFI